MMRPRIPRKRARRTLRHVKRGPRSPLCDRWTRYASPISSRAGLFHVTPSAPCPDRPHLLIDLSGEPCAGKSSLSGGDEHLHRLDALLRHRCARAFAWPWSRLAHRIRLRYRRLIAKNSAPTPCKNIDGGQVSLE